MPRDCLAFLLPTVGVLRLMICWLRICTKHLNALVRYKCKKPLSLKKRPTEFLKKQTDRRKAVLISGSQTPGSQVAVVCIATLPLLRQLRTS